MRIPLFILVLLMTVCSYSQKSNERELKYFDSGTIMFERIFPACSDYKAAGIPNFNNFGMEGEFFSVDWGKWKWKQKASFLLGGKKTDDLIPNIEFEGGYLGGFAVWQNRFSASLGTVFAFQPNPRIEIGIPLMFTTRYTSVVGNYYLYDGQSVDEGDIVEGYEASSANRVVIDRKWMPGFRTGIEVVGGPNGPLSLLARINYQYFGWRDVYDVGTAQMVNGDVQVAHDRVWSTPEWGFSIGLRYTMYTVRKTTTKSKPRDKKKDEPVILEPKKRQKK